MGAMEQPDADWVAIADYENQPGAPRPMAMARA